MDHLTNGNHNDNSILLSIVGGIGGALTHLYGFLCASTTAVFLGNVVFLISIVAAIYSLYTNRKHNKLTDMQMKEIEDKKHRKTGGHA